MSAKKPGAVPSRGVRATVGEHAAALFLDQYYPFHYEVGFTIERALRDPRLTQHQTVMLWIIHATVGDEGQMPRKDIDKQLKLWFDVTSSAVSKALRGLAKPPFSLLTIEENPASAREKYVSLTPEGRQMVAGMNTRGVAIVQRIVDQMPQQDIENGLHFLRQVSAIVKSFPDESSLPSLEGEHDDAR
jgi:DNA-binding MarR family transcriptional regulator